MTKGEAKNFIKSLVTLRSFATDEQAHDAPAVYPAWSAEVFYKTGDRVLYDKILYKVLQDHTSQEAWTPTDAPSLFARVLIPEEDIIPEWIQPDSTNPYMIGDKVNHNNQIWISIIDNNVWEPGVYGWDKI